MRMGIFPSPACGAVTIEYILKNSSALTMQLINSLGQVVNATDLGIQSAGKHLSGFDLSQYPDGIYNLMISDGAKALSGRVVLRK